MDTKEPLIPVIYRCESIVELESYVHCMCVWLVRFILTVSCSIADSLSLSLSLSLTLSLSQWMTAGRGIVHAEMPEGDGENCGLQLWINLSSKEKVCNTW